MVNLGLTAKSVERILRNKEWVEVYRKELNKRSLDLNESHFPERNFVNRIKPQLERLFEKELLDKSKGIHIRETIQRWMIISDNKSHSLIRLLQLMPKELSKSMQVHKKYSDIPIGPQDSGTIEQMNPEELKRWHEGNVALFYISTSINNLLGFFVSELFFAVEAMCRAICIGSCLEFAVKSVSPNTTIQHDEIFRTLKRLVDKENTKVACKLCPINKDCRRLSAYSSIASIYELFYHLRTIKDYRVEFHFNKKLTAFLLNDYMFKGFELACVIDNIMHRLFLDYLISPWSLADQKEKIFKIFDQIKAMD